MHHTMMADYLANRDIKSSLGFKDDTSGQTKAKRPDIASVDSVNQDSSKHVLRAATSLKETLSPLQAKSNKHDSRAQAHHRRLDESLASMDHAMKSTLKE